MHLLRRPTLATALVLTYLASVLAFFTLIGPACFYRDPGSYFYDAERAYKPGYSSVRAAQGLAYLSRLESDSESAPLQKAGATPRLCVAMASTARTGKQYFDAAVGSLLEGLTPAERQAMYLVLFVAHLDPAVEHPMGNAPWVGRVADSVLRYQDSGARFGQVETLMRGPELKDERTRVKSRVDYAMMLEKCGNTGAEEVLVVEDDVVAVRGWFGAVMRAVEEARKRDRGGGRDHLYIRLFHSSKLLGWNDEEWPTYRRNIALAVLAQLGLVLLARFCLAAAAKKDEDATLALPLVGGADKGQKRQAPSRLPLVKTLAVLALLNLTAIPLVFLAGRLSVFPLRGPLTLMNKYGCCSQGLAFPRARVPTVLGYLDRQAQLEQAGERGLWIDQTIEKFAMENDEPRWAMVPAVLQHVGLRSATKEFEEVRASGLGHRTFNYNFELFGDAGI